MRVTVTRVYMHQGVTDHGEDLSMDLACTEWFAERRIGYDRILKDSQAWVKRCRRWTRCLSRRCGGNRFHGLVIPLHDNLPYGFCMGRTTNGEC